MKVCCVFLVVLLCLCSEVQGVIVEEGGLSFSLEAVKRLQDLTDMFQTAQQNPCLRPSTVSVCADPLLPKEFLPLCKQQGASASLARLAMVPIDICEICSFAACSGCLPEKP